MAVKDVFELVLPSASDTRRLGWEMARAISESAVIALSGPLGAGKTTFAQGFGSELGVHEPVNSPTFTMINEYTSGRMPFYHLDLYRVEEAGTAGGAPVFSDQFLLVEELDELRSAQGVILVEWPERLSSYLAELEHIWVELNYSKPAPTSKGASTENSEMSRTARVWATGNPTSQIVERVRNVYFS